MNIQEIRKELDAINEETSQYDFDENGNPIGDRHEFARLVERAAELEEMLFGKSLTVVR